MKSDKHLFHIAARYKNELVAVVHQQPGNRELYDNNEYITDIEVYKKKYKPTLKNDSSIVLFFYTLKDF